jgi:hypothetical protein
MIRDAAAGDESGRDREDGHPRDGRPTCRADAVAATWNT